MSGSTIIQFDWRRNWKKKVVPHLQDEPVQAALDAGMILCDSTWKRGDAPWEYGAVNGREGVEGKLSWYQPAGRCHFIAPFSHAIGQIIYPDLSWKIVSNNRHSVAVGMAPDGTPRVVMDILNFSWFSAEMSMEFADPSIPDEQFWAKLRERVNGATPPELSDTSLDSASL
jgi:hypothetical protein